MQFRYVILTKTGQKEKGVIDSNMKEAAAGTLRKRGAYVLELVAGDERFSIRAFLFQRVPKKEQIMFTRQLALMVKSGLPIVQALTALQEQTASRAFAKIIRDMASDLKGGATIEATFAKHPEIFPRFYTNVLKAGEKSGKLEEVLLRLADQIEHDYQLTSRIRGAMAYPILILFAIIGVVILMLIFVIPQLEVIFAEAGARLPLITRALLGLSNFTRHYIVILIPLFAVGVWLLKRSIRTDSGSRVWDRLKLRIPIFGKLFQMIAMARFSRTMATLVAAGLPLLEVFDTVKDVVGNTVYRDALVRISHAVENGTQLSAAMQSERDFPVMITHLIAVGEQSGNLDYILANVANFFDSEVEQMTKNLSTLLEPLMMIVMGIGVGLVVASVIVPIYNLVNLEG